MTLASLILIAALSGPQVVPVSNQAGSPSKPPCSPAELQRAGIGPGQVKRLDELPPALHQMAVLRTIGGCSVLTVKVGAQTYFLPAPDRNQPLTPADGRARRRP